MYHSVLKKINIQKQFLDTIAEIATQLINRIRNLKWKFYFQIVIKFNKIIIMQNININPKKHEKRRNFYQNIRLQ